MLGLARTCAPPGIAHSGHVCAQANIDMKGTVLTNWLPTTDPCSGWIGVTCTDGSVTALCALHSPMSFCHASICLPPHAILLLQRLVLNAAAISWRHLLSALLLCGGLSSVVPATGAALGRCVTRRTESADGGAGTSTGWDWTGSCRWAATCGGRSTR